MAAITLFWIGLGWWAITMLVQWLSAGLGRWRRPADTSQGIGGIRDLPLDAGGHLSSLAR